MTANVSLNQSVYLKQSICDYLFQVAVLSQELKEIGNLLVNIKSKTKSTDKLLKKGLMPLTDIEDLQRCCVAELELLINKQLPTLLKKRQRLLNKRFQAYSKAFKQWEGEATHG